MAGMQPRLPDSPVYRRRRSGRRVQRTRVPIRGQALGPAKHLMVDDELGDDASGDDDVDHVPFAAPGARNTFLPGLRGCVVFR